MKKLICISILVQLVAGTGLAVDLNRLKSHCQVPKAGEPIVQGSQLSFNDKGDLRKQTKRYNELYKSGLRLQDRFYLDEATGKILAPVYGGNAKVAERFINSIALHLQTAMKRKYADLAFFGDMGHNHYHLPKANYEKHYAKAAGDRPTLYTEIMADPEMKMLYHTGEQLVLTDDHRNVLPDPYLQWRYYTRNIVGGNDSTGILEVVGVTDFSDYNTVREYDDYFLYSGGVYIHATKEGCFSFQQDEKTVYFDLSYTYFP